MIVNASFQDSIEIREHLLDFFRNLCNDPDLHRVGQAWKGGCNLARMKEHVHLYSVMPI
jgi:hypothetical protein